MFHLSNVSDIMLSQTMLKTSDASANKRFDTEQQNWTVLWHDNLLVVSESDHLRTKT